MGIILYWLRKSNIEHLWHIYDYCIGIRRCGLTDRLFFYLNYAFQFVAYILLRGSFIGLQYIILDDLDFILSKKFPQPFCSKILDFRYYGMLCIGRIQQLIYFVEKTQAPKQKYRKFHYDLKGITNEPNIILVQLKWNKFRISNRFSKFPAFPILSFQWNFQIRVSYKIYVNLFLFLMSTFETQRQFKSSMQSAIRQWTIWNSKLNCGLWSFKYQNSIYAFHNFVTSNKPQWCDKMTMWQNNWLFKWNV